MTDSRNSDLDAQSIISGTPVGLWSVDLRDCKVRFNNACAVLLEINEQGNVLNLESFLSRLKPERSTDITARWNAAMTSPQGELVAEHAIGKPDNPRWLLTKAVVSQRETSGEPLRVSGFCLDITERKSMEQTLLRALSESEAIINMAPTALAIVHGHTLAGCNRAMEDLFGYPMRQLIGSPLDLLFANRSDWRILLSAVPLLYGRGSTELGKVECRGADGRRFWALISGRCMSNADDKVFTFTDISRPLELVDTLATSRDATEAASNAKSEFLATMSHDIRTPMNVVLGMLELLGRTQLDDDQQEILNTARESAADMFRLIEDILDFSKIEDQEIDVRKMPVVSLGMVTFRRAALHKTLAAAANLEPHGNSGGIQLPPPDQAPQMLPRQRTISPPQPREDEHRLVLVVEDHPLNRMLIQRLLELLGFRNESARDGQEGLELWRENRFDLVLCDYQTPNVDGFDLARAIRREEEERPGQSSSILIACTTNTHPEDIALIIESGMNDRLFKPVTLQALKETLDRWLPPKDLGRSTDQVDPPP